MLNAYVLYIYDVETVATERSVFVCAAFKDRAGIKGLTTDRKTP